MADPKTQLLTMPLAVGMDNVSLDEVVQLNAQNPRVQLSRNTRLSKVPGIVSKAPGATLLTSGLGSFCGGIVPVVGREGSALFLGGRYVSRRVVNTSLGLISALNDVNAQQDPYFPVTVERAGQVPGGITNFNVATCYQPSTGYTFFARIEGEYSSTTKYIVVTAIDDSGRVVNTGYSSTLSSSADEKSPNNFVGLSAHGSRVFLWYGSSVSNALNVSSIGFGASLEFQFTGSFLTPVITPNTLPTFQSVAIAYDPDDANFAYVATRAAGAANSVTVMRMDMSGVAPSIVQAVTIAMGGAWDNLAIAYKANDAVLLAVSRTSGTSQFYELNRTSLATTWSQVGRLYQGVVACGFYYHYNTSFGIAAARRVFAVSRAPASVSASFGTHIESYSTGGVLDSMAGGLIHNMHICGQMVTHKVSAEEYYPLLPTVNVFGSSGTYDPTSDNFVSEPAIEIYRQGTYSNWKCVARLGTDLALRYPGPNVSGAVTAGGANSVVIHGDRMLVTYLAENVEEGAVARAFKARYAWLNLGSKQPLYAHSDGGAAYIAGALPAVWDGAFMTEHSPLRAPRIQAVNGSGTSPPWSGAPATYLFAVVLSWRDADGRLHRSAPSNVDALTGTAIQPYVEVYVPAGYPCTTGTQTNERIAATLFVSEPDGLVLYAQRTTITALTSGWIRLDTIAQPVVDAFHPALYTDGSASQELASHCPNASRAGAFVADRLWLLDAERTRAWPSKPIREGFAPEFNPDMYVDFPASAGELLNVLEYSGTPTFLSSTGLWTVDGAGPDALLQGVDFDSPRKLSDIACSQARGALSTPAGMMYVSHNRFIIFQGAPRVVFEIDAERYGLIVGTAIFRKYQEVCFFTAQGYVYVYNWQIDGWSLWDQTVTGVTSLVACAQVPTSGKVLYYGDAGELWQLDPDTVHQSAQIGITSGWLSLGGAQDWNTLTRVILHAKRASAHALQVDIAVDFIDNVVSSKLYSAAEVLDQVRDQAQSLRYDLTPEPSDQNARAVRVTFTESGAVGEAFQPVHLTLEVLKQSGKSARSFGDGASK